MSTSSSRKPKINIRKGRGGVRAYRPVLQDFERRVGRGSSDKEKAIESRRSFQTRRMDDIFDTFRRDIEDTMIPWSSSSRSSLWNWRFPSLSITFFKQDYIQEEQMQVCKMTRMENLRGLFLGYGEVA